MKTYKGNYRCPQCDTYNDTWKLRENTVEKDTVYCWHCGCKVQLNKGTAADGVTRAYEAMTEQIRKREELEQREKERRKGYVEITAEGYIFKDPNGEEFARIEYKDGTIDLEVMRRILGGPDHAAD